MKAVYTEILWKNIPKSMKAELSEKFVDFCRQYLEDGKFYEAEGLCVGVPVILGKGGIEEIVKLELSDKQKQQWRKSVDSVKGLIEKLPIQEI